MTHTDTGQKILVWWCLVWCEPHRSRSLQSSLCWAGCAVAVGRQLSIARAAKPKKGGKKKGGGGPPVPIPSSDSAAPDAYNQETRDIILSLDHVEKKSKDGSYILKDVCLGMYMGAKIGILGKNGAGKSTVMRILAGEDPEFLGDLTMDESIQIGYLPQEPVLEEETVIDVLEPAVKSVRDLVKQFEDVSMQMGEEDADIDALVEKMEILSCFNEVLGAVGQRVSCSQIPSIHEHRIASVHHHVWGSSLYYIHIIFTNIFSFLVFFFSQMDLRKLQNKIDACGAWSIDEKLDEAMEALRCPARDAKVANLSGGELRRIALCRLLLSSPDILLLDEPTNHLDAQSVAWLERFLADFKVHRRKATWEMTSNNHDESMMNDDRSWWWWWWGEEEEDESGGDDVLMFNFLDMLRSFGIACWFGSCDSLWLRLFSSASLLVVRESGMCHNILGLVSLAFSELIPAKNCRLSCLECREQWWPSLTTDTSWTMSLAGCLESDEKRVLKYFKIF